MTISGKTFPVRARAFSLSCKKRSSSRLTSPPRTACFDIFSPPPGDSEVISQLDRLNSSETKIAPRSVRIAVGASSWSVVMFMVSSKIGGGNPPRCGGIDRYLQHAMGSRKGRCAGRPGNPSVEG